MSDDTLEKACREWSGDMRKGCLHTFMGGHSGEMYEAFTHGMETVCNALDASLTAFVREQVERERRADPNFIYDMTRVDAEIAEYKARIATLEAEAAANYALYEKKGTELDGTIRHIEALEAALEKADAMLHSVADARAKTKVKP